MANNTSANATQELITLSRQKWEWMSECEVDALAMLFHGEAVFVHMGTTAILLNKIQLIAVVGGNEVTNPFVVTEVYLQQGDG